MATRVARRIEGCIRGARSGNDRPPGASPSVWQRPRVPAAAIVVAVALAGNAGILAGPTRADPPPAVPQPPGHARPPAWRFWESPTAGGPAVIPRISYVGAIDRGFGMSVECRGSGPSIYISIDNPDAALRQLRFDVPIPVVFRAAGGGSLATANGSARVTATLTTGYMATTNRIAIGIGLADAARAISLIESNAGPSATLLAVEVAGAAGTFDLTGARDSFAALRRACESRKL
ncbi:hypothetical protein [Propylenella binzhouense]|uniref:Uncharacterized protein n=1 Tax=Propylenella binzhouense TaxID=2555902 RepID=A0A964WVG7_9HYPH|nr:hypothetical protein [Propylenella binzhouense]MYZ50166.1 hypothetical protein [Propylenella binzhouense]